MTKKKTPEENGKGNTRRPQGRTPGSARDKREKKRSAILSETGMVAKTGKPKKRLNRPDSVTPEPVTMDTETTANHVERGLQLGLSPKEIAFVNTYLGNLNGTRSYMAAFGCSYATANANAPLVLNRPHVRTYMAERMTAALARAEVAQDRLVENLTYIAFGDVNELIEHRREACRFCHGEGFRYQRTPAQRERDYAEYLIEAAESKKKGVEPAPFDELGGVGFDPRKPPNPDCPECFGEGKEKVHIHDTRNLAPAAAALYEGVEVTKDGIKVKIASKDGARDKLAKIAKLYDDQKTEVNLVLGSDELEKLYRARMDAAQKRAAEMRKERGTTQED